MAKEIERKFLVSGQRWRTFADEGIAIRQAYVVAQDDRSLRVRIYGDGRARLTLKVGHNALVRDEYEVAIACDEAEDMLRHAIGTVIEKVRFKVPHEGHVWEIDVYGGWTKDLGGVTVDVGAYGYIFPAAPGGNMYELYGSVGGTLGNRATPGGGTTIQALI